MNKTITFNDGDMALLQKHHNQYRKIDELSLDEIKEVALQIGIRVISKLSTELQENEE